MRLFSRDIVVPKTYEDTYKIIKSSAHIHRKKVFTEQTFSMHCAQKISAGWRDFSSIRVTGTLTPLDFSVKVTLTVHAGFWFYLGCFFILLGVIGLLWSLISLPAGWIAYVGIILFGAGIGGTFIYSSIDLLDVMEHKLLSNSFSIQS